MTRNTPRVPLPSNPNHMLTAVAVRLRLQWLGLIPFRGSTGLRRVYDKSYASSSASSSLHLCRLTARSGLQKMSNQQGQHGTRYVHSIATRRRDENVSACGRIACVARKTV